MAVATKIRAQWMPRDPSGRFTAYLEGGDEELRLVAMTKVQLRLADAAAANVPHFTGQLSGELYIGGGGNSAVTHNTAIVAPGDPYGPSQDSGFVGSIDPSDGKYYSLADWVIGHGMDEDAIFPIARSLDYEGIPYMEIAEGVAPQVIAEEGAELVGTINAWLGFGENAEQGARMPMPEWGYGI